MEQKKFFNLLAGAVICLLLLTAGCAPRAKEVTKPTEPIPQAPRPEAVTLALKFTPQDSTTYKVVTERERSVELEGALSDESALKGGRTSSRVEMTFTQQIQSVDDEGNAVVKITIKELKHLVKVKDKINVNFDGSSEEERKNPLAKLIGQGYTIKIAPTGRVVGVVSARDARAAVGGDETALKLLMPDAIKRRHTISALPVTDKNRVRPGDSWSSVKGFSFGLLGSESYERVYTFKEIKSTDGRRLAFIDMNAIPSSEMAEQLYKEQTSSFSEMFGGAETYTYTGRLKLDLTAGKIEECFEKLQTKWVIVDPSIEQGDDKEPAALRMGVTRLYSLERID